MVENLIHGFFTGIGFACNAIIALIGVTGEFIQAFAKAF